MDDAARRARNTAKLFECYPAFRSRLARMLDALSEQGFRPRVQEAYRSPADQLKAYQTGHSKLKFGLHNATGAGGKPEALAADVLDDTRPLSPPTRYLLALAVAAADAGLETGILWGLTAASKAKTAAAVRDRRIDADVQVGWDPTHVQVRGLTATQVRNGARPTPTAAIAQEDDMTAEDRAMLQLVIDKLDALREAEDRHYHLLNFGRNPGTAENVVDVKHVGTLEIMEAVKALRQVQTAGVDYDLLARAVVDEMHRRTES